MNAPEGMIPVEEFAQKKGITADKTIKMIRDGFYTGRVINDCWFIDESEDASKPNTSSSIATDNNADSPPLTILFYVLAGLSLLGGIILCSQLWPDNLGYRDKWETIAYLPSITWLTIGIVEFALFTAIGQGLHYLRQIALNSALKNKV
ncbi:MULTISPECIES: hypothetical protein [Alteromonas]|uniref:hypothetical protein n=1 Tax=Alteromonas TaxID=226 RepID=UPI0007702557|nr:MULTISPECIES: hypothetical protein [Alteromonas]AMJ86158.1 hypothetical protein AV939_05915 [Alteromonas sp. Mac1]AMJ90017.1 hypothetical protein AV940_05760 [Alteromonas sp. Mac2]ANB22556.1 hypothetical protein A6K25_15545 [Alteromonas stellipolaris]